jgi:hypothetical protein
VNWACIRAEVRPNSLLHSRIKPTPEPKSAKGHMTHPTQPLPIRGINEVLTFSCVLQLIGCHRVLWPYKKKFRASVGYLTGIWRVFEWESDLPRNYPTLQNQKTRIFRGFSAFCWGNTINKYPDFFFVGWTVGFSW